MALIKCNECGKEISDKAKACVNCGNPIFQEKVKNMKKKKWEELTEEEKRKIAVYRNQIKQWYIGSRIIGMICFICVLFPILLVFIGGANFVLPLELTCLIVGFVCLYKADKEDKQWYEKNIDKIYEEEILK